MCEQDHWFCPDLLPDNQNHQTTAAIRASPAALTRIVSISSAPLALPGCGCF
ncbi:hypothetical protein J122_1941 [Marinobacter excellens LAMA 842]|uniref:Uncharacterized protein n=1 Tax=Marinobacter excellens LAMA 842 TaxID=1306954 RepID=A0A137SC25_9GAMM|nr:hypothetical protein J122_1941 [Marinobacter excellens LAMA 842]